MCRAGKNKGGGGDVVKQGVLTEEKFNLHLYLIMLHNVKLLF